MATDADAVIAALVSGSDQLAPVVENLTPEQLTGPSAAAEWNISQVLSHLGSGAVIALAGLEASLAGKPNPGMEFNRSVWPQWDAMGSQERADRFLVANSELLARYLSLDEQTRATLQVDLGFLPEPVPLAGAASFRLNEFTLHSWDVRVALDPRAVLHPDAVPLLLGMVAFMFGWLAKPAALEEGSAVIRVKLTDLGRSFTVQLGENSSIGPVDREGNGSWPDAVLSLPAHAWLRLVSGRLKPQYTPDTVSITGSLSLDDLRAVFPGF